MFKKGNFTGVLILVILIGLSVILAIIVILTRVDEAVPEPTVLFVSSSEAREKINEHQGAFILDVRTIGEFVASRIPESVNIPYDTIAANQDLLPENKHTPIFVYCRTGRRAGVAASDLTELGYTKIIVFPGMIDWEYETVSG